MNLHLWIELIAIDFSQSGILFSTVFVNRSITSVLSYKSEYPSEKSSRLMLSGFDWDMVSGDNKDRSV